METSSPVAAPAMATDTAESRTRPRQATHADLANAVRVLAMDAIELAQSGHPGLPMGMADAATVLVSRFLKFDPADPDWPDRDRLVLSAGHGSMLLYALLHLTGYPDMDIDQLRRFRQLGSRTPGHPERGLAAGVETTTGPLGQGLANALGLTLAERLLAARFGAALVDHHTYVIASDGDLMEGISHEAASLAGHLRLGRLIVLFDDNRISIDGPTALTVSDDQPARFEACGWHVQSTDGHDPEAVAAAITAARAADRPSLIACRTTIGHGAPGKEGTAASHGAPLGGDEIAATRQRLKWPSPPFEIPDTIAEAWRAFGQRSAGARAAWRRTLAEAPERAAFEAAITGDLPEGWRDGIAALKQREVASPRAVATRKSSQSVLGVLTAAIPNLVGGSADLTGSNNTQTADMAPIGPGDFLGRYIYWGVREHAMAAAMNGIALHGGLIPYAGTFLVFSDYARPAIRLAALMGLRVIYVMTHDSIGLGEDGPTHQPVEHLAASRAIPNLAVFRPADTVETAECWALALERKNGPSLIALTRQSVPAVRLAPSDANLCAAGGYELLAAEGTARVSLIATGSEVSIAVAARALLEAQGVPTRVVSLPCWELLAECDADRRDRILGADSLRVGIEAATSFGWERWLGPDGLFLGMTGFGASAPHEDLYRHFGLTAEDVAAAVGRKL